MKFSFYIVIMFCWWTWTSGIIHAQSKLIGYFYALFIMSFLWSSGSKSIFYWKIAALISVITEWIHTE